MRYAFLYVVTVVVANYAFSIVPLLTLPTGDKWSPVALVVGFTFVIRDYTQREIGHWVIAAMLVGGIISGIMVDKSIAAASVCAFMVGELVDWIVYTYTKRPFSQRILLSSAIGTPIDSIVFMAMVGLFSFPSVFMMTTSKMIGAFAIFIITRRREKRILA